MDYRTKYQNQIKLIEEDLRQKITSDHFCCVGRQSAAKALNLRLRPISKRLRGVLFSIVHSASGCTERACTSIPAALEMVHCASLIFDDIQDGHEIRWGHFALMVELGPALALNTAVRLLCTAQEIMINIGPIPAHLFNDTILQMLTAQDKDILYTKRMEYASIDDYYSIAGGKTGTLFSLAARLGAHSFPNGIQDNIAASCLQLGIAYQIQDDIDDIIKASKPEKIPGSNVYWFIDPDPCSQEFSRIIDKASRLYSDVVTDALAGLDLRCSDIKQELESLSYLLYLDKLRNRPLNINQNGIMTRNP